MKTYHIVFDPQVRLTYTPAPAVWRSMLTVLRALRARGAQYAIGRRSDLGGYIRIVRPDDSRYLYSRNPYRRAPRARGEVTERVPMPIDMSEAITELRKAVTNG